MGIKLLSNEITDIFRGKGEQYQLPLNLKNIVNRTTRAIVSWPNPKQWRMVQIFWFDDEEKKWSTHIHVYTYMYIFQSSSNTAKRIWTPNDPKIVRVQYDNWTHNLQTEATSPASSFQVHFLHKKRCKPTFHTETHIYWNWTHTVQSMFLSMIMMTSSNENIFRVTGPLCGEFTGPGEFPAQRRVTRSFDVFFDLRLNKRLSKQPWGWWFETPSWSLWCHCNVFKLTCYHITGCNVKKREGDSNEGYSVWNEHPGF